MTKRSTKAREAETSVETPGEPDGAAASPAESEGPTDGPRTWEQWAKAKGTPDWLVAAARMLERWPIGKVLEEKDFDAAIAAAGSIRMASPRVRRGGTYGPGPQKVI